MTPQPKSPYQIACDTECPNGCGVGNVLKSSDGRYHRTSATSSVWIPCTAPTKEQFMERQAKRIEELEKALRVIGEMKMEAATGIGPLFDAGISAGFDAVRKVVQAALESRGKEEPNAR